ncbi:hypothetical protein XELAEV_18037107mg [Xenopus laevis]|uniref:Protein kinase domain-containing protein n=1 Tax=Xenopus laevis TaxID=8355 RepID=A0A974HAC3_XENLA|nr:hypothetical protein XELAEV_18037107mg [Xenopus laevis]
MASKLVKSILQCVRGICTCTKKKKENETTGQKTVDDNEELRVPLASNVEDHIVEPKPAEDVVVEPKPAEDVELNNAGKIARAFRLQGCGKTKSCKAKATKVPPKQRLQNDIKQKPLEGNIAEAARGKPSNSLQRENSPKPPKENQAEGNQMDVNLKPKKKTLLKWLRTRRHKRDNCPRPRISVLPGFVKDIPSELKLKEKTLNEQKPSPIPLVKDDPVEKFDSFEFLKSGGFGKVYKVRIRDKQMAAKVSNIDKEYTEECNDIQEIRMLQKLKGHRNIVSIYDTMIQMMDDSKPYNKLWCMMEYGGAGSLHDIICSVPNQSLPEQCIQFISREVLQGLSYIHKNLIIHCDIKSLNIILTEEAEVKIIDFGLAIQLKHQKEKVNRCRGTPHWMAPEVIQSFSTSKTFNLKCDIWSFGIMEIAMAERDPPYLQMSTNNAWINIVRNEPPTLQSTRWSKDFKDFLKRCLTKSVHKRPTADNLLRHRFITNQPNHDEARSSFIQYMTQALK